MAGYTVGVDVGGTKILAAVVDDNDEVVARAKVESPTDSSDAMVAAILEAIHGAIDEARIEAKDVAAIGLGVPGVVGPSGECIWAPNCPLTQVPVADLVKAEFGLPTAVGNDVNVGTFGERTFGAARGFDNVFGMFVGTGIGGGLVVDGKVIIGDHCLGAEVGHILIDYAAAARGDEGGGEFEYEASRLGIERRIREAVEAGRKTKLKSKAESDDERIKSGALKKALKDGDEVVTEVLRDVSEILGIGAVTVIHICDPEAIIFGGGVIEACGDFMLPLIEESIARHVAPGNGKPIRLVRSSLGDGAVLLGAVALARAAESEADRGDYPLISAGKFGSVVIDGQKLDDDIIVRANGKLKKRKKKLSRQVHGTSHEVSEEEIRYICKKRPDHLIIGHGHHGQLALSDEAKAWLDDKSITYELLDTPTAALAFNRRGGRKALLLHVNC